MAEDQGKQEEEKFDFTREGEALGYISLDQARVLAMRTARESPGAYGRRFRSVPMAFEVIEDEETEDHYVVTLAFRPEGAFAGTPGREQFFIEKEGNLAVRQVLSLPGRAGWRRIPVGLVAIGLVVVVAGAVGGVFATTGGGGDNGSPPPVSALPTSTLGPSAATQVPVAVSAPTAEIGGSTSRPRKGPLVYEAKLDGTLDEWEIARTLGDPQASEVRFLPGVIEMAVSRQDGILHVGRNSDARIRYIGELDISVSPGSDIGLWWPLRAGPPSEGNVALELDTHTELLRLVRDFACMTQPCESKDEQLTPWLPIPGFQTGKRITLTAVVEEARYQVYLDGEQVVDLAYNEVMGWPTSLSFVVSGGESMVREGVIRVVGARIYELPSGVQPAGAADVSATTSAERVPTVAPLPTPIPTPTPIPSTAALQPEGAKVVYYDARYPATFADRYTGTIVPGLLSRGYQVADAVELRSYMEASGEDSCVVFAQDVVPDTVVDNPTAPTSNSLIRKYMERGGRVVWIMDVPFFYVGFSDGSKANIGDTGHRVLSTVRFFNDDDNLEEVRITAVGTGWGLTQPWRSTRPSAGVTTKLAIVSRSSDSAAYHLNFGGPDHSGFVRIWDTDDLGPLTPEHLDDLDRMCKFPGGLVHHWPADGDAQDIVGANHGILRNGATFAPGRLGQAFSFDGVDDRVEPAVQPSISTAFTISAWVNFDAGDFGSFQNIFNNNQFFLRKDSSGEGNKLSIFVKLSDGTVEPRASSSTVPSPGTWHQITGTWDGATMRVYVNGFLEGSSRRHGTLTSTMVQAQIGRGELTNLAQYPFSGRIDEVRIYNRALAGDEIKAIYDADRIRTVYSNDFEGAVGPEWSNTSTDTTPVGARKFLGRFGNGTVSLALANLPPHTQATVSFDLYIIHSWDGNDSGTAGPDIWDLSVAGGPTLLRTTFCQAPSCSRQAYPGTYPGGDNPARTGATENNTLGYTFEPEEMDSVYQLGFTFDHSGNSLELKFSGSGLERIENESWGLDNLVIQVSEPIPGQ